jgi:hypothetical protein
MPTQFMDDGDTERPDDQLRDRSAALQDDPGLHDNVVRQCRQGANHRRSMRRSMRRSDPDRRHGGCKPLRSGDGQTGSGDDRQHPDHQRDGRARRAGRRCRHELGDQRRVDEQEGETETRGDETHADDRAAHHRPQVSTSRERGDGLHTDNHAHPDAWRQ